MTTFHQYCPLKRKAVILPVLLLTAFALQAESALPRHSVTIDEYAHVPAGYSYWTTGDFSLYSQNPPLIKLWMTLPLLVSRPEFECPQEDGSRNPWECGRLFLVNNFSRYQSLFNQCRTMVIILGLVLGLLLFIWTETLYGYPSALVVLLLYCFCPNMLAHSQLATPDIGFCLTTVLALFTLRSFCLAPSWKNILFAGCALGCAEISKFTALVYYPLFVLLPSIYCLLAEKPMKKQLVGLAAIVFVSLVLINAGYLFQGLFHPLGSFVLKSRFLTGLSHTVLGELPLPLPFSYVQGFDKQMVEAEGGYIVFLNGVLRTRGWWYYFLEAFVLKTPVPLLSLIGLRCLVRVPRAMAQDTIFLILPILTLFVEFSFLTDIDLGLRYILPVYPLLFIWVSPVIASMVARYRTWGRIVPAASSVLLFMYGLSSIWIFPHHLSYFNAVAGGPEGGYRYLIDSNIDWGQDLPQLKKVMDAKGIRRITLAYFGVAAPEVYGISYSLPSPHAVLHGYLAVSVSILQGKGRWISTMDGRWVFLPENALTWVKRFSPIARAGYSIYLYKF